MTASIKSQVFTLAHQIAKDSAAKFGGKAYQYLSGALKQAWTQVKSVVSDDWQAKLAALANVAKPAKPEPKVWHNHAPTNYSKAYNKDGSVSWGAWISVKEGEEQPKAGDLIIVKTKKGELHTRTISNKWTAGKGKYKTGYIISLVADEEVAKKAAERYQDAKIESQSQYKPTYKPSSYVSGWCNKCQSYCYGDCEAA